jgi:predicted DNA-binding transcriptional regulator YafY
LAELCDKLGASRATVNRLIAFLRVDQGQDIRYDREHNGYRLHRDEKTSGTAALLGLNSAEAASLLEAIAILEQIPPGLIRSSTTDIRSGLQRLCRQYLGESGLSGRIQLRASHPRKASANGFGAVLESLRAGKRIEFLYRNRGTDDSGTRNVSPVRLVLYRSNWYLAAWDHGREGLRIFSLDRIIGVKRLAAAAHKPPARLIERELDTSYGIFTGEAKHKAVLLFDASVARWVAEEQWHPDARAELLDDGRVRLTIPYRIETELVMEILRYGSSCLVQGPASLRRSVAKSLQQAAGRYADDED